MLEAVLFDLDGTLLDTSPDFLIATNILLQRHQQPTIDRATIIPCITNGSAGIIEKVFNIGREHPTFKPLWDQLLTLYLEHIADQTHYYQGMQQVIAHITQCNLQWGIVTNKPSRYTEALLQALDISTDCCVCADHVEHAKPAPDSLLLACQQISADVKKTIYVGDHLRDITAAKAAGMKSVAVSYGFIEADENPSNWGAEHLINDPLELIAIIDHYLH